MRKAILSSLLTAAVLFPATSHAATVTLTDVMGVTATFVSPLGSHNEALAGAIGVTHASALPVPTAFEAYCIDLLNPLFFAGDYDATLGPPMSLWVLHQPSQITDGGEAAW